ncbi:sigma factor [Micromonospora musae]|uniref:Sigma-70 family RNA polymerase sigma factor n=1 Tax=Micromonospora musae TaxID=1894970 RepID=A0A3A9XVG7_9ACTN|nr:sigma factor [Micromonospora musae]RKN29118.1 sigma-70 family RNA polymerase sigma factor [Micromonospora musae]
MGPPGERDEDWFTGVYAAEYGHVVRYGQRRLADGEAAVELAQEVFVIAWRRRRDVPDRCLPWLYVVARRLLANEWRARRAAPDLLPMTDAAPDQESRDCWQRRRKPESAASGTPAASSIPLPPMDFAPLPSGSVQLTRLLHIKYGGGAVTKQVGGVYGLYVVPRRTRAEILRVLADVPGFRWRGQVVDRAGRKGVAITFDDREHDQQSLLIFAPETGELLAYEVLSLSPVRISMYQLILRTGWTDQLG